MTPEQWNLETRLLGKVFKCQWPVFLVTGADSERYLNGQLTNDLSKLTDGKGQLSLRLDAKGRLQGYVYIFKSGNTFKLVIPDGQNEELINDIFKFAVMDDVDHKKQGDEAYIATGCSGAEKVSSDNWNSVFIAGEEMALSTEVRKTIVDGVDSDLREIYILNGFPFWGVDVDRGDLPNNTRLNELGISYEKGCFLGQETVAKINNNRGGHLYPVAISPSLESESGKSKFYDMSVVALKREQRVEGANVILEGRDRTVTYLPFLKDTSWKEKAVTVYDMAHSLFMEDKDNEAVDLFHKAIHLDPSRPDTYESLGVLYGRLGKYQEAIDLMDELGRVDPDSVMVHTNKSLYLMKLGRIEEAEKEKDAATLKTFENFGKDAENKAREESLRMEKEQEMLKRENMFKQVLDIDENDVIANYGLADIAHYRGDYEMALEYIQRLMIEDQKHSNSYLLKGKCLEAMGRKQEAVETYQKGIGIASAKGELMPANEMQSRLTAIM